MLHIKPVFAANFDKITEVLHVIPVFDADNQTVTICVTRKIPRFLLLFMPTSWITELLHISDGSLLPDL